MSFVGLPSLTFTDFSLSTRWKDHTMLPWSLSCAVSYSIRRYPSDLFLVDNAHVEVNGLPGANGGGGCVELKERAEGSNFISVSSVRSIAAVPLPIGNDAIGRDVEARGGVCSHLVARAHPCAVRELGSVGGDDEVRNTENFRKHLRFRFC